MGERVIDLRQVYKSFVMRHNRTESLKQLFIGWLDWRRRERRETFWALEGVDLQAERGEMVGLIGTNGSGKSTLLRIVAGILEPDKGQVEVRGRVAPMIEVGVGFHPELTGEENLYLNAALYGLCRDEIDEIRGEIVAYSELEKFIDVPIKNYSTGMYMRLGFAVAVHLRPDILLVDEVLAVGDEEFQEKCLKRMQRLRAEGACILLVSHDLDQVAKMCDNVYVISNGKPLFRGPAQEAVDLYRKKVDPASSQ
ncbi:MAG TPA: ABC transporter ATP-binding protein [Acidobacteriota bacterium]|nr:ABC transporter ATP-binding protein [Acidobacteriota bacterium]